MARSLKVSKGKMVQRVIEILDYFDNPDVPATAMSVVRRCGHPQSSTSETLAKLVSLGILSRDLKTKSFALTPRAALMGTFGQPAAIRDGDVQRLMERLRDETNRSIGLHSVTGLHSQVVCSRPVSSEVPSHLETGTTQPLTSSVSGWCLLSTLDAKLCEGVLRRLNAEASEAAKFVPSQMRARIDDCGRSAYSLGPASKDGCDRTLSVLLHLPDIGRPLALSLLLRDEDGPRLETIAQGFLRLIAETFPFSSDHALRQLCAA